MTRARGFRWAPAAVIVAVAAGVGVASVVRDGGVPDPLAIASSAPSFDSLDALIGASDVVVAATVTAVDDGRTITAPDDPDTGIRTRLVRLEPTAVLVGELAGGLVVEEAAALADGDPIVVDGMSELAPGDQAIWFLVAGSGDEMPYYAALNAQARYELRRDAMVPAGDDALSRELAALGPDGLIDAIAESP